MIMFLYISECLKRTNTGTEASIATMIGALKPGSLIASTDLPKHKYVMTSILKHLKAQERSAGLPELPSLLKTEHRALTFHKSAKTTSE